MLLDRASQLKKGMVVYYCHCFPKKNRVSYVTRLVLMEDPQPVSMWKNSIPSMFVDAKHQYIQNGVHTITLNATQGLWEDSPHSTFIHQQQFSLGDAGIGQHIPRYNDHALFDDLDDAKVYIQSMLGFSGTITCTITVGTAASTSPGTPTPEVDTTPQSSTDDDWDRAMRGI